MTSTNHRVVIFKPGKTQQFVSVNGTSAATEKSLTTPFVHITQNNSQEDAYKELASQGVLFTTNGYGVAQVSCSQYDETCVPTAQSTDCHMQAERSEKKAGTKKPALTMHCSVESGKNSQVEITDADLIGLQPTQENKVVFAPYNDTAGDVCAQKFGRIECRQSCDRTVGDVIDAIPIPLVGDVAKRCPATSRHTNTAAAYRMAVIVDQSTTVNDHVKFPRSKPVDVTLCVALARDESNDLDFNKCVLGRTKFETNLMCSLDAPCVNPNGEILHQ